MLKHALALIFAATAAAQTPHNPFEKPPADVEEALRTRVTEFYQDHVEQKYRKAEQLVSEDSKDGFYASNKPDMSSFRLTTIVYSDEYQKAKVTVVAKMTIMFAGMGKPQVVDAPFPSYWKMEGGKWCWYIYKDPNRMTPFGAINPTTSSQPGGTSPAPVFQPTGLDAVLSSVKADKQSVTLERKVGSEQKVVVTNHSPGKVILTMDGKQFPGGTAALSKSELMAGEKAEVRILAGTGPYQGRTLRVLVSPFNLQLEIAVTFAP